MLGSNHHIELNPADCGNKDTFVVQEVIKEIAQFGALDAGGSGRGFKVVVLSEVDQLSKDAQAALRRTMEKYTVKNLRFVGSGRFIAKDHNHHDIVQLLKDAGAQ